MPSSPPLSISQLQWAAAFFLRGASPIMIRYDHQRRNLGERKRAQGDGCVQSKGEKKQARAASLVDLPPFSHPLLFLFSFSSSSPTSSPPKTTTITTDPAPLLGRHRQDGGAQGARPLRPGLVLHPGGVARPQGLHAPGESFDFFVFFLSSFFAARVLPGAGHRKRYRSSCTRYRYSCTRHRSCCTPLCSFREREGKNLLAC